MELPEELWSHIFSFLSSKVLHKTVSLVCKDWLRIVRYNVRYLNLRRRFLDKLFDGKYESYNKYQCVTEEKMNEVMSNYLKKWPKLQSLAMFWCSKSIKDEDLLNFSLTDFKKWWNLPYIKSITLCNDRIWKKPVRYDSLTYTEESLDIQGIHFDLDSDLNELEKSFRWLVDNVGKIEAIEVKEANGKDSEKAKLNKVIEDFVNAKIDTIKMLKLYSLTKMDGNLKPILQPLVKSTNLQHVKMYFNRDARGYTRDLKFLKELKHLKSIHIDKSDCTFLDNFKNEIPFIGVSNNLTFLLIEGAAMRIEQLLLIGNVCQCLETLRIEGEADNENTFTHFTIRQLEKFLLEFKAVNTIQEMRLIHIMASDRYDCRTSNSLVKREAQFVLQPVLEDRYSASCFVFILYNDVHHLMTLDDPNGNWGNPNLFGTLIVKEESNGVKVTSEAYNQPIFDRYFDRIENDSGNTYGDYVLKSKVKKRMPQPITDWICTL